jgi:hypothetical protein
MGEDNFEDADECETATAIYFTQFRNNNQIKH